jgi:hypothetical protein
MNGPQPNILFGNAGRGRVKNDLGLPKGQTISEWILSQNTNKTFSGFLTCVVSSYFGRNDDFIGSF